MMRSLLAGTAIALATTCLGYSLAEAEAKMSPPPMGSWSYLCFEARGPAEVMEKANQAGARGWEMVAATSGDRASTWCFRQPSWARPEANQ